MEIEACEETSLVGGRGKVSAPQSNRLIDTDVLLAGFADLLSTGHLQR